MPENVKLIVRFVDGVTAEQAKAKIEKAGARVERVLSPERNTYLASADSEAKCVQAIASLKTDPHVVFVERDHTYSVEKSISRTVKGPEGLRQAEAGP